jgi:hypothetical protein
MNRHQFRKWLGILALPCIFLGLTFSATKLLAFGVMCGLSWWLSSPYAPLLLLFFWLK